MKIKSYIFALFVVLSIVPLFIIGVSNMLAYNNQVRAILKNDLGAITQMQVKVINNFLTERSNTANIIVGTLEINRMLTREQGSLSINEISNQNIALGLLRENVKSNPYLNGVCITDASGKSVVSTHPVTQEFQGELYSLVLQNTDKHIQFIPMSESHFDNRQERSILAVESLFDNEALVGFLVMELNLDFFEEVRSAIKLFNNGTVYLLDQNNEIIVAGNNNESIREYVLTEQERSDFVRVWNDGNLQADEGVLEYKAQGNQIVTYYARMQPTGWTLLTSIDVDTALKTRSQFFWMCVCVVVLGTVVLVSISYFVSRKIAMPMEEIAQKFAQIREKQDYSMRMSSSKTREINSIVSGINLLLEGMEIHLEEEKARSCELLERVLHDQLTGLYNKKGIDKELRKRFEIAEKSGAPIALCYLDIDDFKQYNTLYGHASGDEVLQYVGAILQEHEQCSARMGGDEYVFCITDAGKLRDIELIVRDIIATLNVGLMLEDTETPTQVSIGCCIGITIVNAGEATVEELLDAADQAMYKVKNAEKNGFYILQ